MPDVGVLWRRCRKSRRERSGVYIIDFRGNRALVTAKIVIVQSCSGPVISPPLPIAN